MMASRRTTRSQKQKQTVVPKIKLFISTWNKDSHGLYDYDSTPDSYKTQSYLIDISTRLERSDNNEFRVTPLKTAITKNGRKGHQNFSTIANIAFEKKEGKATFSLNFQPIAVTGTNTNASDDSKRSFYKVLQAKDASKSEGFALKAGQVVKLGRVEYMVLEVKNDKQVTTFNKINDMKDTSEVFEYVKPTAEKTSDECEQIRCKICLVSEQTQKNPLISPCKCKGSMLKIHMGCLKKWINSKVKKQAGDQVTSYNFTKFDCEICKHPFPKIVKMGGLEFQMMTIIKPSKPYIILETLNKNGELLQEENCLHVIASKANESVRIGRGHQCQIRLMDISASRHHAKITYQNDQFVIRDEKSKFGTLIKFDSIHSFEADKPLKLQYGRTVFELEIMAHQEEDTEEEENQVDHNQ